MAYSKAKCTTRPSLEDERFVLKGTDVIDILGLECEICNEPFDTTKRLPKFLPCSHTFCLYCLEQIVSKTNYLHMSQHKCPICRGPFTTHKGIINLPNDHRIFKGLDIICKAKETFKNVCFKHNCKALKSFCKTCEVPICNDCITLSHNEDLGHVTTSMSKGLSDNAGRFDDMEETCKAVFRQIERRLDGIKKALDNVEIQRSLQECEINKSFAEYSKMLHQRKKALIESVSKKANKRKRKLESDSIHFKASMDGVQTLYDDFRMAREDGDARDIFKVLQALVGKESEFTKAFCGEDVSVDFHFQALNEDIFIENLITLGLVHTK